MKRYGIVGILILSIVVGTFALMIPEKVLGAAALSPIEQLGKSLFFDQNLSKNGNQSCATCHDPAFGYTGPASDINALGAVYPGSDPLLFGNRKPPTAAYAGDSPILYHDSGLGSWVGGMFWDGRADGSVLGDPLAEQAKGPFLNPLEQGLSSPEELCAKVAEGSYVDQYVAVFQEFNCDNANQVYDNIGRAIAAYERSSEVSPFSSKFDAFWNKAKNKKLDVTRITTGNYTRYRNLGLTDTELYGLALFNDPNAANCASCHSLKPGSKGYPLFTDFSYDNLGLPRNPANPFYDNLAYNPEGSAWTDFGLGGFLVTSSEMGKMKVPTLRNVDKRPAADMIKAFGHNGAFKSLTDIVRFYAWRSMMNGMGGMGGGGMGGGGMGGGGMGGMCGGSTFGEHEVAENLATLKMFPCHNVNYLVAFLRTLSDR